MVIEGQTFVILVSYLSCDGSANSCQAHSQLKVSVMFKRKRENGRKRDGIRGKGRELSSNVRMKETLSCECVYLTFIPHLLWVLFRPVYLSPSCPSVAVVQDLFNIVLVLNVLSVYICIFY